MPLQNRVTPFGEIVADPARGLLMGNRGGALHDGRRRLGRVGWRGKAWIACLLSFRRRWRPVMAPNRYTELFFLDEAVAFAAGHRPCAECRRADFERFVEAWRAAFWGGRPRAPEIDAVLHAERVDPRTRRQIARRTCLDGLPDGAFVALPKAPEVAWLVRGDRLLPFRPEGYGSPVLRPQGADVDLLTPPAIVAVLRADYVPMLHPSAADGTAPPPG